MNCCKTQLYRICIVLLLFNYFNCPIEAQTAVPTVNEIIKSLTENPNKANLYDYALVERIAKSKQSESIFRELEEKAENHHLRARIYGLKAAVLYYEDVDPSNNSLGEEDRVNPAVKSVILELWKKAINEAYLSGDDRLIAMVSIFYGNSCSIMKELELAVTYTVNGLELNEKLGITNSPTNYMVVGEIFYKIREYDECARNSIKAFRIFEKRKLPGNAVHMMFSSNTAALGYHRRQQYDSAFFWYQTSLKIATALNLDIWKGIIGGNMGQIYYEQKQYDTALALFMADHKFSTEGKLYDNAANSLQWAARTQLQLGNNAVALQYVREALSLLEHTPERFYLRNTYYTAVDVFKSLGVYDSAFYYNAKYATLNDSLEKMIAFSGITVSKERAYNEKSSYRIQSLQKEKEKQLLQRNILITVILLLGIVGFLVITRQRLKAKLQLERLEQEKQRMQLQIESARDQLHMFTENIVEKTSLIEKLEEQVKGNNVSAEQQHLITELSQQTILTEEDWIKFKSLFEKIYPFFFQKLKENAADITIAEQRMAALVRLQLTSKQMAAMLGISVDSVHKTRQRLRQRLQLNSDVNLDDFIAGI